MFNFCPGSRWLGRSFLLLAGMLGVSATELKYFQTFQNVDYTSAGVGGIREVGYGTIQLTGVSGAVTKAFLYWHGHQTTATYNPDLTSGSVTFNGVTVVGQLIGTSGGDGWGQSPYYLKVGQAFRADVTDLVQGNGSYVLGNFVPMGKTVQGASLVVVFDDQNPANNRDIAIADGCDQNSYNTGDGDGWNISFPGVNYVIGDAVDMEFHVSDGQSQYFEAALYLNRQLLAPASPIVSTKPATAGQLIGRIFDGTAPYDSNTGFRQSFFTGSLWDIKNFNIVPLLSPGVNNVFITSGYEDDDLTVVAVVAKYKVGGAITAPIDNNSPVVACSGPSSYGCATSAGVTSIVQATISDPDNDALTLNWSVNGVLIRVDTVAAGESEVQTTFAITNLLVSGTYTISATVQDSKGGTASCDSVVVVEADKIAPTVNCGSAVTIQADSTGFAVMPDIKSQVSAHDSCTPDADLKFVQSPAAGAKLVAGTYTISYTATDLNGNSASCTAALTVVAPVIVTTKNNPPVAKPDTATTPMNVPVNILVLSNDSDPDNDPLQVISTAVPNGGIAVINLDRTITYTPPTGFVGSITFQYTISDGKGGTSTATVTVTITNVVVPPPSSTAVFTTYTQGGWGSSPSGNNPGTILMNNFSRLFPAGVTIGGTYKLTFTSAPAIDAFLPQGGSAAMLTKSAIDPVGKISVLAGQTLALQLSVACSNGGVGKAGLGSLPVSTGKLKGWTVNQVLALCNQVLGGTKSALPSGVSIADLNNVADSINRNFDNGTSDNGYLVKPKI